jgi:hypothetical protein
LALSALASCVALSIAVPDEQAGALSEWQYQWADDRAPGSALLVGVSDNRSCAVVGSAGVGNWLDYGCVADRLPKP